jgi:pimeloyl-ACP methyl ester carboxylesterase
VQAKSFSSFDGTPIAYLDAGDGPPVLLIHGYMSSGLGNYGPWSETEKILRLTAAGAEERGVAIQVPTPSAETEPGIMQRVVASGRRVLAPDMRGHGDSGKPTDPAAYAGFAMAKDMSALLDHLGLDEVDVMGYSMGSITTLRMLSLGERRIRSAILGGMGAGLSLEGHPVPDYTHVGDVLPAGLEPPVDRAAYCAHAAAMLRGEEPEVGIPGAQAQFADLLGFPRPVAACVINSLGEGVRPETLAHVDIPILVLNGDDDLQKLDEAGFADVLPTARFGSARGDHSSSLFDPAFQAEVLAFLREQG